MGWQIFASILVTVLTGISIDHWSSETTISLLIFDAFVLSSDLASLYYYSTSKAALDDINDIGREYLKSIKN